MARSITLELFRPTPAARQALALLQEAWAGMRPTTPAVGGVDWLLVREGDAWAIRFEAFGQSWSLPIQVSEPHGEIGRAHV